MFTAMSDFVNHIHNNHMMNDSNEYTCMWKDCTRKLTKKVAFKGLVGNLVFLFNLKHSEIVKLLTLNFSNQKKQNTNWLITSASILEKNHSNVSNAAKLLPGRKTSKFTSVRIQETSLSNALKLVSCLYICLASSFEFLLTFFRMRPPVFKLV